MGLFTAVSRVLGFVRDTLIAFAYGTSPTAQAFVVAFRIPNLLRDMVGEGAANSAFVPVLTRTRELQGKASWSALTQAVWSRMVIGFLLLSAVGILAAPWLVTLVAPGFRGDPLLMEITVRLTRILFPFIGLVGLAALFMGVLNSAHHFTLPSLGPIILSICMIAGMFAYKPGALGLAWGVIVGGILQLLLQLPLLRRLGVSLRLTLKWHPGVGEIRRLLIPRMIGTGVYQFGVMVDTVFASFQTLVGPGGLAVLYFAQRFLHLPMALFGISMAQAALPTMSRKAASGDLATVRKICVMALRSSLLIAIPASVGLIFLGMPIVQTLLERGAFSAAATQKTVVTLQCYALGLASMCAAKVLANTLYAFHDTWTPVRSAAFALAANVALNILLVEPLKLPGLALATSLASFVNSVQLYYAVRARVGRSEEQRMRWWLLRVLMASLGMGLAALTAWNMGLQMPVFSHGAAQIFWLILVIVFAVVLFFVFGLLLGVEEAWQVGKWLAGKVARIFAKS